MPRSAEPSFRFGNHQTLSTQYALLFPFGDMWFEVAIIEGNTPFLLSASFLKRIGVIIDIEKNTLWSGALKRYLQIGMSPRNLMMLDINEFWSSKKKIQVGLINDAEFQESLLNQEYIQSPRFFFSSRLADVALRLGPYMSISGQKDICTRTQEVHQSWQIKINQKNTRPTTTTTRKSPSQICVSSRENSKPDKKTGQGPNKQTTTIKICQRTQRIYHYATPQKPAK